MRVLCVGDVFAPSGVETVLNLLPKIKRRENIDLCIVNGENSAIGNGVTKESAELIFSAGADVITGGNHSFRQESVHTYYEQNPCLLRPHNIEFAYGGGYVLYDMGKYQAAVINLSGQIGLQKTEAANPFSAAEELVARAKNDGAKFIFVDFHAEMTSEKRALGFFLDGKVSAVFGTHTHVQTADSQVLPQGTGYITDLGMTGVVQSILGVKKEIIINRLKDNDMSKFEPAVGECALSGCIFDIDEQTGLCLSARIINERAGEN